MPVAASVDSASTAAAVVSHVASAASTALVQVASAASVAASPASSSSFASNDAWLNGLATLVGGLVAAWVAYRLQVRATKKKEREQGLVEAHQLMFCLVQQLNTILLVWGDHFSHNVEDPGRFMNVPATTPFDLERYVIDVAKMTILLDSKAGRSVLYDLNIAQEAYREALLMLNERSRVHRQDLQPALEKSRLNGTDVTNEMMMDELGERLILTMIRLTDGCYTMMHKSFMKLAVVNDKARKYIVERFGTDDFTKVDFPDTKAIENEPRRHYPEHPFRRKPKSTQFGFGTAYNWCRLWPEAKSSKS